MEIERKNRNEMKGKKVKEEERGEWKLKVRKEMR